MICQVTLHHILCWYRPIWSLENGLKNGFCSIILYYQYPVRVVSSCNFSWLKSLGFCQHLICLTEWISRQQVLCWYLVLLQYSRTCSREIAALESCRNLLVLEGWVTWFQERTSRFRNRMNKEKYMGDTEGDVGYLFAAASELFSISQQLLQHE